MESRLLPAGGSQAEVPHLPVEEAGPRDISAGRGSRQGSRGSLRTGDGGDPAIGQVLLCGT